MGAVRNCVTFVFIGTWLLMTLAACETSKHAEIMSTEDLRAQAQKETAPSDQSGIPFEGESIDQESLGLSETFTFTPTPPPSPASPPSIEIESSPEVPLPAPAPVLSEGYSELPRVERSPASDYVPDSPPQVFRDARVSEFRVSSVEEPAPPAPMSEVVEESVPAEEPMAEPEPEVAKLEPDDFVPEAPAQEEKREAPVPVKDSGLADVFFDFDQYAIRPDAVPVLENDAELLKSTYKDSNVLIEGHCDERGTVEYNLELGKRRAQAVKDYLVDLGVEESRIRIVSYGKEKPFCTESKPGCWQKNRRGHFVHQ